MATFFNQASLSFGGRVTNSNVTEGEIITGISLSKTAVTTEYTPGGNIVYSISIVNAGDDTKENVTLTDNLGKYALPGGNEIVPLTYVDGSVLYYVNGVLQPAPTVVFGETLSISDITIPAGGNVTLLYETTANEFAPLGEGSAIFNNVCIEGNEICDNLCDSAEVPVRSEPLLSIAKAVSPEVVTCGNEVTYTFIIQNNGKAAVVATDNLTVNDIFNPVLENITVRLNGQTLTENVGYTYDQETGVFASTNGAITVPAATYARDPQTGIVTTTPGVAILTVTGRI